LSELIARGKAQYQRASAGVDKSRETVENFVPGSRDGKRRLDDRFVRTVVVLREKLFAFNDSILVAGSDGKIRARLNAAGISPSFSRMGANLRLANSVRLGVFDVVHPCVAQSSNPAQSGFDVVGCHPDRHTARLRRLGFDGHM
jgi:hypothetical protein